MAIEFVPTVSVTVGSFIFQKGMLMKKYLTTATCKAGCFALLMLPLTAFASGNGGGAEPPPKGKNERSLAVCSIAPWLCAISANSGNGGGNEPPPKKGND